MAWWAGFEHRNQRRRNRFVGHSRQTARRAYLQPSRGAARDSIRLYIHSRGLDGVLRDLRGYLPSLGCHLRVYGFNQGIQIAITESEGLAPARIIVMFWHVIGHDHVLVANVSQ